MSVPIGQTFVVPAAPRELDALLSAISDAVAALVAWNITAFESAMERQSAICDRLALQPEWRQLPASAGHARKVQDLNRVYERLLQHSVDWTRTIHHILQTSGDPFPRRASMHFRG